jgi:hypothetical protein
MARYRLLAGQFIMADKSRPITGADGKPTGRFEKLTYTARTGSFPVVESDDDLVAKHGAGKFELIDPESAAKDDRIRKLERELAQAKSQLVTQGGTFRTPGDPTDENLRNNPSVAPGGQVSTGFQGGAPALARGYTREELEGMTVADLKDLAASDEIDLTDAHKKSEIIDRFLQGK